MALHILVEIDLPGSVSCVHGKQHLFVRLIPDEFIIQHQILNFVLALDRVDLFLVDKLAGPPLLLVDLHLFLFRRISLIILSDF
jgi:hypothetical protein